MEIPQEVLKMKLKPIHCEKCISFDRKTRVYCFMTKGKCSPKKKACESFRLKEGKEGKCEKSGSETTQEENSGLP